MFDKENLPLTFLLELSWLFVFFRSNMNGEDEDHNRMEAEKNSRRRPRAASSERQHSSTSSESSYHEAPISGEASSGMTDDGIKR